MLFLYANPVYHTTKSMFVYQGVMWLVKVRYDVVIVGAGPAGIFTALELIKNCKQKNILIIEKGRTMDKRTCPSREKSMPCVSCDPCSIVCGWGGSGAFSDGKLTLSSEVGGNLENYIGTTKLLEYIKYVDDIYVCFGAPQELHGLEDEKIDKIKREALKADLKLITMPVRHLGTGRCQEILEKMKEFLTNDKNNTVDIATECSVKEVMIKDNAVLGVEIDGGKKIYAKNVVVAPGREGAKWFSQKAKETGLDIAVNPVDVGVRVELPAVVMEHITNIMYESKLLYYSKVFDDKLRTFCMNPYGEVVTENNNGLITVNGHTHAYKKTENTNFAILVTKAFTKPFNDPISYGRYIAGLANLLSGGVIVQRLGDLLNGQRTNESRIKKGLVKPTLEEAVPGDLSLALPYRHLVGIIEMLEVLDKIAPGVYSRFTLLYGIEVKFYSFRIAVNNCLETKIKNLFAIGDGAGITRGLVQASISGVIVGREIANRIKR